MNRDKKGRFAKSKKWLVIFIVLGISGYVVWAYNVDTRKVEYTAPVVKVLDGIDEIANRPEIKRQQELIVKEAYVKEEKAKTQEAKKQAIAEFDSKLAGFETELEAIRKEKTSF